MNPKQVDPQSSEYDPGAFHLEAALNVINNIENIINTTKRREQLTFTYLHTQLRWAYAELAVFRSLETHMKMNTITEEIIKEAYNKLAHLRANIRGEAKELRSTTQPSTEEAAANER